MNRRSFLKHAALGAASASLMGLTAASAETVAETKGWDYETDVVIVGAGNGGLSAAAVAADGGKRVIVAEISCGVGGGAIWSGGGLHCMGCDTYEEYAAYSNEPVRSGVELIEKTYVETFRGEYIPWLQAHSIPISPRTATFRGNDWVFGDTSKSEVSTELNLMYFDALQKHLTDRGGQILLNTRVECLMQDEDKRIIGVLCENMKDGTMLRIKASDVILACGGIQANKGLLAQYIGEGAYNAHVMGTPYNNGCGLYMAEAVGAKIGGNPTGLSGVMCVASRPGIDEYDYASYESHRAAGLSFVQALPLTPWSHAYYHGPLEQYPGGIYINLDGKRFMDEQDPVINRYSRIPQKILQQKKGLAILIADQASYDQSVTSATVERAAGMYGYKFVKADTLEAFAQALQDAYHVPKGAFLREIRAYNEAFIAGELDMLDVPRSNTDRAFDKGPFYAIPVTTTIYCTFTGVEINEHAQVIRLDGRPFDNLYACPPTAAMFNEIYFGGNAAAGTFGYIAAKHITNK